MARNTKYQWGALFWSHKLRRSIGLSWLVVEPQWNRGDPEHRNTFWIVSSDHESQKKHLKPSLEMWLTLLKRLSQLSAKNSFGRVKLRQVPAKGSHSKIWCVNQFFPTYAVLFAMCKKVWPIKNANINKYLPHCVNEKNIMSISFATQCLKRKSWKIKGPEKHFMFDRIHKLLKLLEILHRMFIKRLFAKVEIRREPVTVPDSRKIDSKSF